MTYNLKNTPSKGQNPKEKKFFLGVTESYNNSDHPPLDKYDLDRIKRNKDSMYFSHLGGPLKLLKNSDKIAYSSYLRDISGCADLRDESEANFIIETVNEKLHDFSMRARYTSEHTTQLDPVELLLDLRSHLIDAAVTSNEAYIVKQLCEKAREQSANNVKAWDQLSGHGTMPSVVDKDLLSTIEARLLDLKVPSSTIRTDESHLFNTTPIPQGWVMYMNPQALKYISRQQSINSLFPFTPWYKYKSCQALLPGEKGMLGDFIVCTPPNMLVEKGKGAECDPDVNFHTTVGKDGKCRYDVFTILVASQGCFDTAPYCGDSFEIIHTGGTGLESWGVTINWRNAVLVKHPDHLHLGYFVLPKL